MGILIYDCLKFILIYLAARNVFWMLIDYPFRGFDGGGRFKNFNGGEDNDMFLSNIYGVSFVTAANSNITGVE